MGVPVIFFIFSNASVQKSAEPISPPYRNLPAVYIGNRSVSLLNSKRKVVVDRDGLCCLRSEKGSFSGSILSEASPAAPKVSVSGSKPGTNPASSPSCLSLVSSFSDSVIRNRLPHSRDPLYIFRPRAQTSLLSAAVQ